MPQKGKSKGEERYCRERRGREVKSSALHSEVQMPNRHPNRDTVCLLSFEYGVRSLTNHGLDSSKHDVCMVSMCLHK